VTQSVCQEYGAMQVGGLLSFVMYVYFHVTAMMGKILCDVICNPNNLTKKDLKSKCWFKKLKFKKCF